MRSMKHVIRTAPYPLLLIALTLWLLWKLKGS